MMVVFLNALRNFKRISFFCPGLGFVFRRTSPPSTTITLGVTSTALAKPTRATGLPRNRFVFLTLVLATSYAVHGDLIPERHDPKTSSEHHAQLEHKSLHIQRLHNTVHRRDVQWPSRPSAPFAHDAVGVLEIMTQDPDPETRLQGLLGLSIADSPETITILVGALEDPARQVREAALRKLGMLDAESLVEELIRRATTDNAGEWAAVEHSVPRLKELIEPPLISLLEAADSEVPARAAAIQMLGAMGSERAIPVLGEAAASSHPILTRAAARALARIASPDCLPALTELSRHPRAEVRAAALRGLARIGGPVALNAIEAMALNPRESNVNTRRQAIYCVGLLGGEPSIETLINAMNRYPQTRETAVAALMRLTGLNLGNSPLEWTRWYHERQEAQQRQESPTKTVELLGVIPSGRGAAAGEPADPRVPESGRSR